MRRDSTINSRTTVTKAVTTAANTPMIERYYSENEDSCVQRFERKGVVSIWLGFDRARIEEKNLDTLKDLFGVDHYRLSDQESNSYDNQMTDLARLISPLSYSATYLDEVTLAARKMHIEEARIVVAQYDFAYDPTVANQAMKDDPIFLGVFNYSDE